MRDTDIRQETESCYPPSEYLYRPLPENTDLSGRPPDKPPCGLPWPLSAQYVFEVIQLILIQRSGDFFRNIASARQNFHQVLSQL